MFTGPGLKFQVSALYQYRLLVSLAAFGYNFPKPPKPVNGKQGISHAASEMPGRNRQDDRFCSGCGERLNAATEAEAAPSRPTMASARRFASASIPAMRWSARWAANYSKNGLRDDTSRFDAALRRGLTQLVGRQNELDTLLGRTKTTLGGRRGGQYHRRGRARKILPDA